MIARRRQLWQWPVGVKVQGASYRDASKAFGKSRDLWLFRREGWCELSCALLHHVDAVDFESRELLQLFPRPLPAHLYRVDCGGRSYPEVETHVAVGIVAGAAANFVGQYPGTHLDCDSRPDAVAVGGCSYCLDCDPVVGIRDLIHQQAGTSVHIGNQDSDPAVVP